MAVLKHLRVLFGMAVHQNSFDPNDLTSAEGVGAKTAERLREAGFNTWPDIQNATQKELLGVPGIGPTTASMLKDRADQQSDRDDARQFQKGVEAFIERGYRAIGESFARNVEMVAASVFVVGASALLIASTLLNRPVRDVISHALMWVFWVGLFGLFMGFVYPPLLRLRSRKSVLARAGAALLLLLVSANLLRTRFATAEAAIERGDWRAAERALRSVDSADPRYARAQQILPAARDNAINETLDQILEDLRYGGPDRARKTIRETGIAGRVAPSDPRHERLQQIRAEVRNRAATRELAEIENALADGDVIAAQEMISVASAARKTDPNHLERLRRIAEWGNRYGRLHYADGSINIRRQPTTNSMVVAGLSRLDAVQVGPADDRNWAVVHRIRRHEDVGSTPSQLRQVNLIALAADTVGYVYLPVLADDIPSPSRPTTGRNRTPRGIGNELDLWVTCKIAVERNLWNPSSADFPWSPQEVARVEGSRWILRSYVDATNALGNEVRTHFACEGVFYSGSSVPEVTVFFE